MEKVWKDVSQEKLDEIAVALLEMMSVNKKLALYGAMGAGKTTLIKSLCRRLGIEDNTSSPTFAIVQEYHGKSTVYHFDLYRLNSVNELADLGFEEYLEKSNAYIFIEWPEIAEHILKDYNFASLHISAALDSTRSITYSDSIKND